MVKAHSLLYAIYICLLISIICGALLYFSTLYNQLNLHYNLREEMYIQNQSAVNFALGHKTIQEDIPINEELGIEGSYETKEYGLITLLLAKTYRKNDTITSAHFTGYFGANKTAIHLANFSKPLSYSGKVSIIGDNFLPSLKINPAYINNRANELKAVGKNEVSEVHLPKINPAFKKIFMGNYKDRVSLDKIDQIGDSTYYNSFLEKTKEVQLSGSFLSKVSIKGNLVLYAKDSLVVSKSSNLEDVIIVAPKIIFKEGFRGSVQAFASKEIQLETNVILDYPSVLCVHNDSKEKSNIKIAQKSEIKGSIVLFGNALTAIDKNSIEIEEDVLIMGDIYCAGKLMLKSDVMGSVYTNRFFYRTEASTYDNTVFDIEINPLKRPKMFISAPLFESANASYGIIKKVL